MQKPQVALIDDMNGIERWYPDGVLNTCHNAIGRHVEAGRGDQVAIYTIHLSPTPNNQLHTKLQEKCRDLRAV